MAHDFIARLLQPALRSWQTSAWERSRPYLVPVSFGMWLVAIGLIFFYPTLHDEYILAQLRAVGLVPDAPTNAGASIAQNGAPINDVAHFWSIASLVKDLSSPVVRLRIVGNSGVTSLQGMPDLPALTTLDLSVTQKLASLKGMPDLPALTTLNLSFTQKLASLQGMPDLPQLQEIDLRASATIDLSSLTKLPALEKFIITKEQADRFTIPSAIKSKLDVAEDLRKFFRDLRHAPKP